MADREKVMLALNCCAADDLRTCRECPYAMTVNGIKTNSSTCVMELASDALDLLKEQEPRVLTVEEVIHSRDWIWYQWKNTHCGWTLAVDCDGKWIEWEDSTTDQLCKYGKKWRCWTSRPSEQQMRDTKWEEEYETV